MKHTAMEALETAQLVLREFTLEDAGDMFRNWANNEEVTRYLTWKPHNTAEVSRQIICMWLEEAKKKPTYRWCIVAKASGQAVGCIDVVKLDQRLECAEIGYCLSRSQWGKGMMTEALIAVQDFLFSRLGLNRIEACHHTDNPASGRVMQKSGMLFEGVKRQAGLNNQGDFCDVAAYAILKQDWEQIERH